MTSKTVLKALAFTAVLLLAVAAYAGNTVTLNHPTMVNGKQLAPGQYHVKVNGSGPVAEVIFLQDKTEVATAKAKLKETGSKARRDNITVSQNADGTRVLSAIQFEGKSQSIELESGGSSMEASAGK